VFTRNKVKAASVQISQQHIIEGKLHAIIANSGNANACTGEAGMMAAQRMAQLTAEKLGIKINEVAVASTGVIGAPLPIKKIEDGFNLLKESLRSGEQGHTDALEAIMTTDTRKKDVAVEFEIDRKNVRLGAMTKGSGMMHPSLATMLTFFTTDAVIEKDALDSALRLAVKRSFNRLTIDGDTSTNDMVVIMANGEAGNTPVTDGSAAYGIFYDALEKACINLTRKMARDGEGATKLITVNVINASSEDTAEILAKSVASSSLVKAACFGADANWGRVLCAMGYGADNAAVDFNPQKVDVVFSSAKGEVLVCKNGGSVPFSEEKAKEILLQEEIYININLHEGTENACAWGCDLTYDYVKINGDYRS
jgi:glutamate N-acetyltransferase/amino-acid N-acetyltransferase